MKNSEKSRNHHPSKDKCEKCSDHNICGAEAGLEQYSCWRLKENFWDYSVSAIEFYENKRKH